ncbi:butyrate kinase [Acidobacteria bacterium AB60]|nr:butyrate kinase [Acidobacteria bacterium AB60]
MVNAGRRVLAINPGSTSTKVGMYAQGDGAGAAVVCAWTRCLQHADAELERFRGQPAMAQAEFRAEAIRRALEEAEIEGAGFAGVGGRGGLLPPLECGTWLVNEAMIEELRLARRGDHACNLGAVLALRFARTAGVGAYVVDPVTVDEWQACARISGSPLMERSAIGHALNIKAVARRFARERAQRYEELRLIVVHLGSGITVSAHREGRMIDQNTPEEGPFGPDRSGWLPVRQLIQRCFSGEFTERQLDRMVFGEGGLFAYLGTRDLRAVERRVDAGDARAALVYDAMAYQIGKEMGAMAAVLEGRVDAIVLTGGMAHSERLVEQLRRYAEWIAPVAVYPGEDELQALAEGVLRVVGGEEQAKVFRRPEEAGGGGRERLVVQGLE